MEDSNSEMKIKEVRAEDEGVEFLWFQKEMQKETNERFFRGNLVGQIKVFLPYPPSRCGVDPTSTGIDLRQRPRGLALRRRLQVAQSTSFQQAASQRSGGDGGRRLGCESASEGLRDLFRQKGGALARTHAHTHSYRHSQLPSF